MRRIRSQAMSRRREVSHEDIRQALIADGMPAQHSLVLDTRIFHNPTHGNFKHIGLSRANLQHLLAHKEFEPWWRSQRFEVEDPQVYYSIFYFAILRGGLFRRFVLARL